LKKEKGGVRLGEGFVVSIKNHYFQEKRVRKTGEGNDISARTIARGSVTLEAVLTILRQEILQLGR